VPTGRSEWQRMYELKDSFSSLLDLQEQFAQRLVEDLKHSYFLPLASSSPSTP
jgi:hypothetical protein